MTSEPNALNFCHGNKLLVDLILILILILSELRIQYLKSISSVAADYGVIAASCYNLPA